MGSHDDSNPNRKNPDNECYCMKDLVCMSSLRNATHIIHLNLTFKILLQKYKCFKSGVLNMEPCKRDTGAPLALSYPHFYQV